MPRVRHLPSDEPRSEYDRHVHIDGLLRNESCPSHTELARRLGVSSKTIQRDFAKLRKRGAKIVLRLDGTGWRYQDKTFVLPTLYASSDDVVALALARRALARHTSPLGQHAGEAFDAALAALPAAHRENVRVLGESVVFTGYPSTPLQDGVWDSIVKAITGRWTLDLRYDFGERARDRRVDPYGLIVSDGDWFLHGFSHHHQARRTFFVPRIQRAEVRLRHFDLPADFSLEAYVANGFKGLQTDDGPVHEITLRFAPEVAHVAETRRWTDHQISERQPDGALLVTFRTSAMFLVEREVRAWGEAVAKIRDEELADSAASVAP